MDLTLVVWTFLQDAQGRLLLGRREGTRYAAGLWNPPGGRVEPGEPLAQAAAREVREEVGLHVRPQDLECLGVARYDLAGAAGEGPARGVDFFFLARTWTGEPRALEHTGELGWFAPDALPADSLPWLPAAVGAHLLRRGWLTETVHPA